MKIFVDTGAFIALIDVDDENHKKSSEFYKKATEKGARFFTTNFVVCETMNYLRAKVSHKDAVAFREGLKKSHLIEVIPIHPFMEDAALQIFKEYDDKDFSFTDCTSFSVMKSLRLKDVLAFDRHFDQYDDFKRLP